MLISARNGIIAMSIINKAIKLGLLKEVNHFVKPHEGRNIPYYLTVTRIRIKIDRL